MTFYHFLYIFPCFFIILSILFIRNKIGPNEGIGIRVGKAVWNDENWYRVHRFTGWTWLITSLAVYVYFVVLFVCRPFFPDLDVGVLSLIGFVFFLIVGYLVIPTVYNASMPDSHTEKETSFNFDELKSTFAITVYVWLCLLFIFISIPCALNMLEPNTSVGIRFSTTLASDENWYKGHYFEAMATIIGSSFTIVSILFMKLFFRKSTLWYNNGLVYLLAFLIPLILSQFVANVYLLFILKVP